MARFELGQREQGALRPLAERRLLAPEFVGQVLRPQYVARRNDDGPLEHVAELAHVPHPGVVAEQVQRPVRHRLNALAVALGELADEVGCEEHQIVAPLGEGRKPDGHHREPVVEVLAEPPLGDRLLEVAVRRGDQAHVHGDRLPAADPFDLALLDGAEDLGLERETHVRHFVQEQRAADGVLEPSDLARDRAGERPLFVAEQLALQQVLRDRGAVHRDERRRGVWAIQMDRAGDDLLPGARLTLNQHRGGARPRAGHELVDLQHRGTLTHEGVLTDGVVLDRGQRDRDLDGGGAHARQGAEEVVLAEGQGQEVQHAEALGAQHQAHRRIVGRRDQPGRAARPVQRIHPPGKIVVRPLAQNGHHQIPALGRELAHGVRQIGRALDVERRVVGPLPQALDDASVLLTSDDENPHQRRVPLPRRSGGRGRFH